MAYNKAKAEKEWLCWKEAEEKKLRELGVDEETIQRLHTYDWAQFNKERQYLQRQVECAPLPELMDRKKRDIMERKGDKEDENKRQKQQKESSAAAL